MDGAQCRLLCLSAELRNLIYTFAVVEVTPRHIEEKPCDLGGASALLQTCHQIREEAMGLYYKENIFWCPDSPHAEQFLLNLAIIDLLKFVLGNPAVRRG
jgi:hypothetical protein